MLQASVVAIDAIFELEFSRMSTESSGAASSAAALERIYSKHTRATRVLHWTNVIIIGALLWTALLLLSGTPELPYSHWLPPGFYAALHLDNRNDEGRVWHVLFSFLMIAVGVAYTAYLAISGRWKTFLPNATSWSDAYLVVLNDLGIRRHTPSQQKYNGAQRIAYTGVVILGLGEVVTGLAIYIKNWTGLANLLGGQDAIRAEHFAFMLGIIAFIVVHLVQVARAGWNNARSMVTGDEIIGAHGLRATVEQAVPEPALLSAPMPHASVGAALRTKSRGSAHGACGCPRDARVHRLRARSERVAGRRADVARLGERYAGPRKRARSRDEACRR